MFAPPADCSARRPIRQAIVRSAHGLVCAAANTPANCSLRPQIGLRGDQYAIAIGILREGVPFAGVLACPNLPVDLDDPESPRGVIFAALRGEGAKRCPLDEEGWETVRVSDRSAADARVLGSVESAHGDPALVVRMMEDAGMEGGFVRFDSQVKYGVLAQGDAEI